MGPRLVLVSRCFRENVVATCKLWSFLCSLDNLLQKYVVVFFFGNQISKWRSYEKRAIFDLLFTFFSHQGKVTKIPSAHISLTYIHVFCSPYWLFCLTNQKFKRFVAFLYTAPYKKESMRRGKIIGVWVRIVSCKPSICNYWLTFGIQW